MFYSLLNPPKTVPSVSGEYKEPIYGMVLNEDTNQLEPGIKGYRDLRALHNEGKDSCDLYTMIERYQRGEQELNFADYSEQGITIQDFTQVPSDLMEAQNQILRSQIYFESLPLDVRKIFNYDSNAFLRSVGDGTLEQKLSVLNKQPELAKEVETK